MEKRAPESKDAMHELMETPVVSNKDASQVPIRDDTSYPAATSSKNYDATTKLLQYLSIASNETLAAIILGLAIFTYLILGRIGLLLIGVFGGIILHAAWENRSINSGLEGISNGRATNLDILKRVLDWRDEKEHADNENEGNEQVVKKGLLANNFEDFSPETGNALGELVDAVIRDYVNYWYQPILPSELSFPQECRQTLVSFLRSISTHLSRKRPADAFLDFWTNSSSIVIVFLNELSAALSQGDDLPQSDAIEKYLECNPDSNLANILDGKEQKKKFYMISDDLLENFLEKSVYDCRPAKSFLREVWAGIILESTLKSCSKPEWLNGWIIYLLEAGEPDLLQAIDAGMGVPSDDLAAKDGIPTKSMEIEEGTPKKRFSKIDEATEEAMEEAKRLSQLMADEDKRMSYVSSSESISNPFDLLPNGRQHSDEDLTGSNHTPEQLKAGSVEEIDAKAVTSPAPFTSFDQILSSTKSNQSEFQPSVDQPSALILHNANIIIYDDSPNDKGRIRSKPNDDYLVQIEPESSRHPGWMIVRRYPDFESLHEVLRRIAAISGVSDFAIRYSTLPNWKNQTKSSLRGELELYLRAACSHKFLAESEGMKRFLEKDQGQAYTGKGNFGWPSPAAFETMGKGLLDALTSAPKGAAEGGKDVFRGVSGVLGNITSVGQKKKDASKREKQQSISLTSDSKLPALPPRPDSTKGNEDFASSPNAQAQHNGSLLVARTPADLLAVSHSVSNGNDADSFFEGKPSKISSSDLGSERGRIDSGQMSSASRSFHLESMESMVLPPPPSDIPDNYVSLNDLSTSAGFHSNSIDLITSPNTTSLSKSIDTLPSSKTPQSTDSLPEAVSKKSKREFSPLSEQETRVALELIFAIINELYTLSSAWNFRKTLLTAAKTFLLRPGNPSLVSIQSVIQESVITSNTSDAGMAFHLRKLRENTLPTEEELKLWPKEISLEEKEKLRVKARKLLIERGFPAALTGVMGQAATGEALGNVFDCLQIEEVARGLMFGLLLQGMRAIAH
jgi:hypothetical protein